MKNSKTILITFLVTSILGFIFYKFYMNREVKGTTLKLSDFKNKLLEFKKNEILEVGLPAAQNYANFSDFWNDSPEWLKNWVDHETEGTPTQIASSLGGWDIVKNKVLPKIHKSMADGYTWTDFVNQAKEYPSWFYGVLDKIEGIKDKNAVKEFMNKEYNIGG